MNTNAPPFDPVHPTTQEGGDMFDGYRWRIQGKPLPTLATMAFEHGYRMASNDLAGVVDADQAELARRHQENERRAALVRENVNLVRQRLRRALGRA